MGGGRVSGTKDDLKEAISRLTEEVRSLTARVEKLEKGVSGVRGVSASPSGQATAQAVESPGKESPWTVGGLAGLMSRGAVISLILLLALVLRTLTDSGALEMMIGTMLGIGYATLLEAVGLLMYHRKSPFAPIFSISGALLLAAIVFETHALFGSISALPAYGFLAVAGGGMAVISRRYRVAIPVCVGTMAVMMAALSLGFKSTDYFALSLFLVAVNVMAFSASSLPRAAWLRIVVFLLTAGTVFVWGYRLRFALLSEHGPASGPILSDLRKFYTLTAFYLLFYIATPGVAIWRRVSDEKRPFDHLLPSLASMWAYLTCLMVVVASGAGERVLGVVGVVAATCLLGLAAVKGSRTGTRSRGTTTFAFPAALLLALSFRDVSGESVVALAILAWAALSLAWLSTRWESPGVRVTSYFLQATVFGASFLLLLFVPAGDLAFATVLSMTATSAIAFTHYRLVRRTPPSGGSSYFSRFDTGDISGAAPLLVSVGTGFLALRAALFTLFTGSFGAFQAGQTITLNLGALALFLAARVRKNAEIKWIAVMVTILGGGKVFLYDLFRVKGVPIVLSVLSFMIAAAVGSWVLGKWQRPADG